ncbi:MAG: SbcC/MukB-like Walker B domain-containing protein, partial [Candidatus Electryonea clarkiae]|nr:SbcC/MukB-like Walker B domain-containing protein [Candidatus Electryonea clarkiae]
FDISSSDPDAINVLIEEMSAEHHPEFDRKPDWNELHFRAHGRRLAGSSQGLIGIEQRKRALQRQIRTLEQEFKQVGSAIREQDKLQKENDQAIEHMKKLSDLLRDLARVLSRCNEEARSTQQQEIHARQKLEDFQILLQVKEKELGSIEEQLSDIQAKIEQQGLDKLERKQRALERKSDSIEGEIANLNQQLGSITTELGNLKKYQENLNNRYAEEESSLTRYADLLKPYADSVESVEYYVLKTNRGQQFTKVENVQAEFKRNGDEQIETVANLKSKLGDPQFGALYAFYYDRELNSLIDRHQIPIAEVVKTGQREIDEQNQVINEKTQKLIHDLIMGELFVELKASVSNLQTMVRKINGLLRDRSFGYTRYKFNLQEVPHYRDLLQAIQRFHPHSPEAKQELEGFLELHKEEIMNTESGDIPEALDYRNWFRYDLVVQTIDTQGVVMDRKTKSLGSGGEQAVPNYLLILTVAHLLYEGNDDLRLRVLLFDEAFYGIDAGRRDQLLGFANDLGLQLFVASPDLDGVKKEVAYSTTLLVVKDDNCDVFLFDYRFKNPPQASLLDESQEQAILRPVTNNEADDFANV